MIDVKNYPDVIDTINNIINNGGICEVKSEGKKTGRPIITVVEINRVVKTKIEIE